MRHASKRAIRASIHASAREATPLGRLVRVSPTVSIHASAREATRHLGRSRGSAGRFNPRLRTGGDVAVRANTQRVCCFNPRLRTGGDQPCGTFGLYCGMFQSTPPHGRRLDSGPKPTTPRKCFNPRLRTGGDHGAREVQYPGSGSFNPRLRTGGDDMPGIASAFLQRFNPRLRTGGDEIIRTLPAAPHDVSIHASAREATSDPPMPVRR